jgi:transcriptional regulator with XRE-family HTH domain
VNAVSIDQDGADTPGVEPEAAANETGHSEFDGTQVRGLRKVRGLSLTTLAEKTGLSVGYLSQVERNISTPSVKALTIIAQALGVTVGWFFHGGEAGPKEEKDTIVRRGNRRRIIFRDGFVDFLLSPTLEGQLELILTHFRPGASTGEPYTHRGEEGGMVLRGRLEITVGEQNFVLEEGDSFSFPSARPHRYRNVFDGETVVMYAVTPPSY